MHHPMRFWAFSLAVLVSPVFCAGKSPDGTLPTEVDLFAAIQAGDVDIKLFFKDASAGTAVLRNKSTKPLTIKLPDAFGAVPIAAQFFGPGGGGIGGPGIGGPGIAGPGGGGLNAGLSGNQAVGAAFQPGNNNNNRRGGGPFGGPGLFNIEAGKERKLKITSVCLEYGKDEPNTRVAYEIRSIESVANKPEVAALVRSLVEPDADQRAIQAAAWRLANDLSWAALGQLPKSRHLNGLIERYFTASELDRAKEYAASAIQSAQEKDSARNAVSQSPGEALQR